MRKIYELFLRSLFIIEAFILLIFPWIFLTWKYMTLYLPFLIFFFIFINKVQLCLFSFSNSFSNFHSHLLSTNDTHHYVLPNIRILISVLWPWYYLIYIGNQPRVVRVCFSIVLIFYYLETCFILEIGKNIIITST